MSESMFEANERYYKKFGKHYPTPTCGKMPATEEEGVALINACIKSGVPAPEPKYDPSSDILI